VNHHPTSPGDDGCGDVVLAAVMIAIVVCTVGILFKRIFWDNRK
jgi:hypothetical protein